MKEVSAKEVHVRGEAHATQQNGVVAKLDIVTGPQIIRVGSGHGLP
jgi:hypothetical protein